MNLASSQPAAAKRRSLSRDLTVSLIAVVAIVSLLSTLSMYFYLSHKSNALYEQRLKEYVTYLREALKSPLWNLEDDWVIEICGAFEKNSEVAALRILDEREAVIYESAKKNMGDVINAREFITRGGETIGSVEVALATRVYEARNRQLLWFGLFTMLGVITGLAIMSGLILPRLLHNLLDTLIERIKHIAAGNYDAATFSSPKTCHKELAVILSNVNNMAEQIALRERFLVEMNRQRQQAEEELAAHRNHLQELIKARTMELEAANAKLTAEVAERKQAEEAAEAANKAKSMFLANMSHELRTPLNAVLGFSRLMARDSTITSEQRENLDVINRSGEHLLSLLNEVLDMAKIETGKIVLELETGNLYALLQDIGDLIRIRAEDKQLRFRLEQDPALPQWVEIDTGKLRQVLINLLGNAIKFTSAGSIILRAAGGLVLPADDAEGISLGGEQWLYFEVEDSGIGIPPDKLESIFEPFVQAGHSSGVQQGTGLGLAISREFVRLMHGDIGVESVPGRGSRFHFHIPVKNTEPGTIEAAEPHRRVLRLDPAEPEWRVLVVEDDRNNRLLLRRTLESVGFKVREAEHGLAGIAVFKEWLPNLIWMDMRMPVMSGYEAIPKIRALPGGGAVIIIALTASVFKAQERKIIAAGCDAVMHKPYREHDLFEAMAQYLGVCYLYEDDPHATEKRQPLTPANLTELPGELREALHQAVLDLLPERIKAVINQIAANHPRIASALDELTQRYEFEHMLELLEQAG